MKKKILWNINEFKPVRPYNLKVNKTYVGTKTSVDKLGFKYNLYTTLIISILILKKIGLKLRIYPSQFGHQSFDIEYFLREEKQQFGFNIFIKGVSIPNHFLYMKHKKLITIVKVPQLLLKKLYAANKMSLIQFGEPLFSGLTYEYKKIDIVTKNWADQNPKIIFTKNELELGEKYLRKLGLEKFKYVTFTSRSESYYLKNNKEIFKFYGDKNGHASVMQHENELAQLYRNSDFLKYKKSINFLHNQGYKSVRIGAGENKISLDDSFFVDFAGKYRDELGDEGHFLDIFLMHHCKFFVNGPTGTNASIVTTKRPALVVNAFPWPWLCFPPRSIDMYIPKLYTNNDGKLIHFSDLLNLSTLVDWRTFYDKGIFFRENKDLTVIDNSSEEILAAVKEMFFKVKGNKIFNEEETITQRKFKKLFQPIHDMYYIKAQISSSFIEKHKKLII